MAANAGSMFQYWKRFDLQQLQVSLSLTTLPCFLNAVKPRSGCSAVFAALRRWVFFSGLAFFPLFSPLIKAALSRWSEIDPLCSIHIDPESWRCLGKPLVWAYVDIYLFLARFFEWWYSPDAVATLSAPDACLWLCYGWIIFSAKWSVLVAPATLVALWWHLLAARRAASQTDSRSL